MKLLIIWLLTLFDYIMTRHYIAQYGIAIEQNLIFAWLYEHNLAFIIKMGVTTITCILCYIVRDKPIIKAMTWGLLIFYSYIAIHQILLPLTWKEWVQWAGWFSLNKSHSQTNKNTYKQNLRRKKLWHLNTQMITLLKPFQAQVLAWVCNYAHKHFSAWQAGYNLIQKLC